MNTSIQSARSPHNIGSKYNLHPVENVATETTLDILKSAWINSFTAGRPFEQLKDISIFLNSTSTDKIEKGVRDFVSRELQIFFQDELHIGHGRGLLLLPGLNPANWPAQRRIAFMNAMGAVTGALAMLKAYRIASKTATATGKSLWDSWSGNEQVNYMLKAMVGGAIMGCGISYAIAPVPVDITAKTKLVASFSAIALGATIFGFKATTPGYAKARMAALSKAFSSMQETLAPGLRFAVEHFNPLGDRINLIRGLFAQAEDKSPNQTNVTVLEKSELRKLLHDHPYYSYFALQRLDVGAALFMKNFVDNWYANRAKFPVPNL